MCVSGEREYQTGSGSVKAQVSQAFLRTVWNRAGVKLVKTL